LDETRQGWLPGVFVAKETVDTESAIGILFEITIGQASFQGGAVAYEMSG
jgi:hypothetical protein